jgi:hypothetical protein
MRLVYEKGSVRIELPLEITAMIYDWVGVGELFDHKLRFAPVLKQLKLATYDIWAILETRVAHRWTDHINDIRTVHQINEAVYELFRYHIARSPADQRTHYSEWIIIGRRVATMWFKRIGVRDLECDRRIVEKELRKQIWEDHKRSNKRPRRILSKDSRVVKRLCYK